MIPVKVAAVGPLVHAITNYVTMDWVARGLLAVGAHPVMARDGAEAAAMASAADALVLNLGTWSPEVHGAMLDAAWVAGGRKIPIVLDPVGAGAMRTRTESARAILGSANVTAIRGNIGEIAALAGVEGGVRGVDSRYTGGAARVVKEVARQYECIAIATGPVDVLSDGRRTLEVKSGRSLMAQIPGAGCLASALVAAALASDREARALETAAGALLWAGLAGELAAAVADGPGSFAPAFLDALATIDSLPSGRIVPPLADRLSVYVIVSGKTPLTVLEQVLQSGVGTIQFREKTLPYREQVPIARAMRNLCDRYGALFLINDRVDLALAVGAGGVHLGQDDLPIEEARRLLGPDAIIGGTCETAAETRAATDAGADYIGTGPVYATPSKADAGDPYGPDVVGWVSQATHLPVIGIGGIGPGNAAPVIAAGACGVAVISSVVNAADPGAAAHSLMEEVATAKGDAAR
ncbi:MAG TPA: hydroxyethylthiazole kinase [Symbiobacteriaceae bacterium]|nr:hydroxyethylthiazole kinase [Symbiobacteriaceae bacterium]